MSASARQDAALAPHGDVRARAAQVLRAATLVATTAAAVAMDGCSKKEVVQGFPDEYVGVGLELRMEGDWPMVVRTLAGGPSAAAGVVAGDRVTDINGVSMESKTLGDVVMRLRGSPSTQVSMGILRGGQRIVVVVRRSKMKKEEDDYKPIE